MSTRSFVYVKIKEEDKGTKKKADLIEVGLLDGDTLCYEDKGNVAKDKIKDVELNGNYIGFYHHFDGYLSGLGKTLLEHFDDYDTILNIALLGDESSIVDGDINPYCSWERERWDNIKPTVKDELGNREYEYEYLFDDDKWYYRRKDMDWTLLTIEEIEKV